MADENLQKELEKLRLEVTELSKARKEADLRRSCDAPEDRVSADGASVEAAKGDVLSDGDKSQLEELAQLLKDEANDHPAIAFAAVFTLGLLAGRLLR